MRSSWPWWAFVPQASWTILSLALVAIGLDVVMRPTASGDAVEEMGVLDPLLLQMDAIFAVGTVVIVAVPGLIIRLSRPRRAAWAGHPLITVIGVVVAILFLIGSWASGSYYPEKPPLEGSMRYADPRFLVFGWFLLAFFLFHAWPAPRRRVTTRTRAASPTPTTP